jgi:hypothetical protein
MSIYFFGHGQKMKLGFRSGVSFSNFYSHHLPGEIPRQTFQANPNGPQIIPDPNADRPPSSYHYETDFINDMRIGFFSSFFLDWVLEKRLSAEIGLGYCQKGIDMEYNLNSTSINADNYTVKLSYRFNRNLRLDYIVIPLTFQYKLDRKERFYVLAGIYNSIAVNFLIKESLVATDEQIFDSSGNQLGSSEGKSWTTDAYAGLFDLGLLAGIGVSWPLTKRMAMGIDIRSAMGLINIPRRYEEYGFQSFNKTSKNISFETGLKLYYILK